MVRKNDVRKIGAIASLAMSGGSAPGSSIGRSNVSGVYVCDPSVVSVGQAVMETAAGSSVVPAQADSMAHAAIGICSQVAGGTAVVVYNGEVSGFTALDVDQVYYLSPHTAGAITTIIPSIVGHVVQSIGRAKSDSVLVVETTEHIMQL